MLLPLVLRILFLLPVVVEEVLLEEERKREELVRVNTNSTVSSVTAIVAADCGNETTE